MHAHSIINALNLGKKADDTGLSLWEHLAGSVATLNEDQAKALCDNEEGKWKAEKKENSTPSAYRSAKSVAFKAIRMGVSLLTSEGKVKGKTEVEKECKEEKATMDKIRSTIETLNKLYQKCDSGAERAEARSLIADLSIRLFEEAKAQGEVK